MRTAACTTGASRCCESYDVAIVRGVWMTQPLVRLLRTPTTATRDDDDYDIDFYTVEPVPQDLTDVSAITPSPREQLEFLVSQRPHPPNAHTPSLLTVSTGLLPRSTRAGKVRATDV